ncbi:MAG: hypothetical protein ACRDNW_20855 [Trebonia sp.]
MAELAAAGVASEEGPAERTAALGTMISRYLRDPDQNLIELSHYPRHIGRRNSTANRSAIP